MSDPIAFTRRQFLSTGLVLTSAAVTVPAFINRSAFGLPMPGEFMSEIPGVPTDHVLVVVQLGGGNDGLNSVVPFGDPNYYRVRPSIGIRENNVLKLDKAKGIGLHPNMKGILELHDEGLCAIVQGVGYPNPNRSHFKSMDIWHTADTSATGDGWLGRYFDSECCGVGDGGKPEPEPMAGIAVGREAPLAMQGRLSRPIGFEDPSLFRWLGKDVHDSLSDPYEQINRRGLVEGVGGETNAGFLMRTSLDAQISSDQIRRAVAQRPLSPYPNNELSRQLQMISSMIRAGLKTRVYYANLGGFDTHAGQGGEQGRHAQLMETLSSSLRAFYEDLKKQGNDGRVLTMSFSEFGRRVAQNASGGTDHGTAAPMFLFGPMVKAGVHGKHPSLTDLDQGDLKYGTDFRGVYAAILESWLKADSRKILEGSYRPFDVINKA